MFRALINVFKIPELRSKVLFTAMLLSIYRVGFHVPLPGVDQTQLAEFFSRATGGFGRLAEYFAVFTGGSLQQSTIFGLGIMPYISAAIIFELLITVVPSLEKLHKEGETGRRKIREYTRYATVLLCVIQSSFWLRVISDPDKRLVYTEYAGSPLFWIMGVLGLTTGTIFLMWLGEQIDEYGIGNGISLIITAGIIARIPRAVVLVAQQATLRAGAAGPGEMGPTKIVFLITAFIFVVAGAILITQGQRRIPVQQAKQMRGRRMYGGMQHYLPLRVNHGGVMPIIFASSLLLFPDIMLTWLSGVIRWNGLNVLQEGLRPGQYLYTVVYVGMVYFFAYFWTTVQFRPKEMAEQLRDYGSFIPGLRPGKRTEEYLERVMERVTYAGAAFLAVIAVIPSLVAEWLKIPFGVSAFLGGTGLLIVVSVLLDLAQRIEANLLMRNYPGFLTTAGGGRIKGAYG